MKQIFIHPISKNNWEEAVRISLEDNQLAFVPSVLEGIAFAYIKPWDEALDPFVLIVNGKIIGFFYLSYTPDSKDNYWIGGFQIDKAYQGKGYGKEAMKAIIEYITKQHAKCRVISLTVEQENRTAQNLYVSLGFLSENKANQDNEMIYRLKIDGA